MVEHHHSWKWQKKKEAIMANQIKLHVFKLNSVNIEKVL